MQLTDHQIEKQDDIISHVKKNEKRIILKGSAGVGKTTLINNLIKVFRENINKHGTVWVTAPTHKAVSVIRDKITKESYIEIATIHSALKLKRQITKAGEEIFVKSKYNPRYPPLQGCVLLIIDEASMLGVDIVGDTNGRASNNGLPILDEPEFRNILTIFVGDGKQLNPVGEDDSPIFQRNYPIVELYEIVRQGKDNPIIDLSYNINKINQKKDNSSEKEKIVKITEDLTNPNFAQLAYGFTDIDENGQFYDYVVKKYVEGFVYTNNREKIIERLAEINGTNELKYLAYTNDEVDRINRDVREKIYGLDLNIAKEDEEPNMVTSKVMLDEYIVLSAPYFGISNNTELKIKNVEVGIKRFIIPNENTEFSTIEGEIVIKESLMRDSMGKIILDSNNNEVYPFNTIDLEVYYCTGLQQAFDIRNDYKPYFIEHQFIILHERSEGKFQYQLKVLNGLCRGNLVDWRLFYWLKEQPLNFKHNHALTVHRSQGSTFEKVIINVGNLNINKNVAERKRLFYTAITRASELVILYNVK